MKAAPSKSASTAKPWRFFFPVLLAVLLAVLFWKSFLPGYVHFSNDGPLGQVNAAWAQPPGSLTGSWSDLNDIGASGGAGAPEFGTFLHLALGPVGYSKFLPPCALFILGLGAWTFFRQLKLSPMAATLGGLAAALNSAFFSTACWGVASQQIAIGFSYFALALVASNSPETPRWIRWVRWALAGLCVGINVMHGADIGAIFSVFVAAFVLVKTLVDESGPAALKMARGAGRVVVIAVFAGFIAFQTVSSLLGIFVVGNVGTGQDTGTKARQWDWATQWSEPKIETLAMFVPGLFGYKMDTPNNMMEPLQNSYRGGAYWGGIGRDPNIDRFLDQQFQPGDQVSINSPENPGQNLAVTIGQDGNVNLPEIGPVRVADMSGLKLKETVDRAFANKGVKASVQLPPGSFMRQTGGGDYVGILVALLAAWAVAQSFRRQNSAFTLNQRRMIWFWFALLAISLPLSFGRFGFFGGYPFRWLYELPYASLIRNPTKFILVFSWAMVVLFAYGVEGLSRRYLGTSAPNIRSSLSQLQSWWKNVRGFDRRWTIGCGIAFVASVLAWLIYASQKAGLAGYLRTVEAPGDPNEIAAFSIGQAGWLLLFFAVAIGIVILIIAGVFSGRRAKLGGVLLGALLIVDMGRANLPWITHWNYPLKYATDPIIDILRDKSYERRVIQLPFHVPDQFALFNGNQGLYGIEWVQQLFPYYNIQSLDLVMRPRVGSDLELYESLLLPTSEDRAYLLARHWQLTNTRYLLGPAGYLDVLNEQLDPAQRRFRILQPFTIVPKPGVAQPTSLSELAAAPDTNGPYALFEFAGALPRAKLYSHWQIGTNSNAALKQWLAGIQPYLPDETYGTLTNLNVVDQATLKTLTATNFDPWQTVLLAETPAVPNPPATAANQNPGTVEFTSYAPTDIKFHTQASTPTVLLLNDEYDPHWRVTVDGKPAPLLRANFIMRGVYLTAGDHAVEFQFSLPAKPLYVTLSAMALGILLCGFLFALTRNPNTPKIKSE